MSLMVRKYGGWLFGACALAALLGLWMGTDVAIAAGEVVPSQEVPIGGLSHQEQLETCAACHGKAGNSSTEPATPKLAGQKASYLAAELRAFRSGRRRSDTMSPIAAPLSDEEITSLARYFAGKTVRPDPVDDAQLAALGGHIYEEGGRGTPACAACHDPQWRGGGMMRGGMGLGGMGRMGMSGGMGGMMRFAGAAPWLAGQHADYVVQQLDAFASGKRPAIMMDGIAARLDAHERKAVAAYLSGLR